MVVTYLDIYYAICSLIGYHAGMSCMYVNIFLLEQKGKKRDNLCYTQLIFSSPSHSEISFGHKFIFDSLGHLSVLHKCYTDTKV